MSQLVNPILFRLKKIYYWNVIYNVSNIDFKSLHLKDVTLFNLLQRLIWLWKFHLFDYYPVSSRIVRFFKYTNIYLFFKRMPEPMSRYEKKNKFRNNKKKPNNFNAHKSFYRRKDIRSIIKERVTEKRKFKSLYDKYVFLKQKGMKSRFKIFKKNEKNRFIKEKLRLHKIKIKKLILKKLRKKKVRSIKKRRKINFSFYKRWRRKNIKKFNINFLFKKKKYTSWVDFSRIINRERSREKVLYSKKERSFLINRRVNWIKYKQKLSRTKNKESVNKPRDIHFKFSKIFKKPKSIQTRVFYIVARKMATRAKNSYYKLFKFKIYLLNKLLRKRFNIEKIKIFIMNFYKKKGGRKIFNLKNLFALLKIRFNTLFFKESKYKKKILYYFDKTVLVNLFIKVVKILKHYNKYDKFLNFSIHINKSIGIIPYNKYTNNTLFNIKKNFFVYLKKKNFINFIIKKSYFLLSNIKNINKKNRLIFKNFKNKSKPYLYNKKDLKNYDYYIWNNWHLGKPHKKHWYYFSVRKKWKNRDLKNDKLIFNSPVFKIYNTFRFNKVSSKNIFLINLFYKTFFSRNKITFKNKKELRQYAANKFRIIKNKFRKPLNIYNSIIAKFKKIKGTNRFKIINLVKTGFKKKTKTNKKKNFFFKRKLLRPLFKKKNILPYRRRNKFNKPRIFRKKREYYEKFINNLYKLNRKKIKKNNFKKLNYNINFVKLKNHYFKFEKLKNKLSIIFNRDKFKKKINNNLKRYKKLLKSKKKAVKLLSYIFTFKKFFKYKNKILKRRIINKLKRKKKNKTKKIRLVYGLRKSSLESGFRPWKIWKKRNNFLKKKKFSSYTKFKFFYDYSKTNSRNYFSNVFSLTKHIKFSDKIFFSIVKDPIVYVESGNLNKIAFFMKIKKNKPQVFKKIFKKSFFSKNNNRKYLLNTPDLNKLIINKFIIEKLKKKKLFKFFEERRPEEIETKKFKKLRLEKNFSIFVDKTHRVEELNNLYKLYKNNSYNKKPFYKIYRRSRKFIKKMLFHLNGKRIVYFYKMKSLFYKYIGFFSSKLLSGTPNIFFVIEDSKFGPISPQFLIDAVMTKVKQRYKIGVVLYALTRAIRKHRRMHRIIGMRIESSGRFSRRDRSSYELINKGRLPLNTKYFVIDYAIGLLPLRYSVFVCKVWLTYAT